MTKYFCEFCEGSSLSEIAAQIDGYTQQLGAAMVTPITESSDAYWKLSSASLSMYSQYVNIDRQPHSGLSSFGNEDLNRDWDDLRSWRTFRDAQGGANDSLLPLNPLLRAALRQCEHCLVSFLMQKNVNKLAATCQAFGHMAAMTNAVPAQIPRRFSSAAWMLQVSHKGRESRQAIEAEIVALHADPLKRVKK